MKKIIAFIFKKYFYSMIYFNKLFININTKNNIYSDIYLGVDI